LIILTLTVLAKISFHLALNQSSHRFHGSMQPANLPGLLLGVSSYLPQG
jgi:hypothetical protein